MVSIAVGSAFHLVSVGGWGAIMNPGMEQGYLLTHGSFDDLERERIGDKLVMEKRHFLCMTNLTPPTALDCIEIGTLRFFDNLKWDSIFQDYSSYFSQ